MQFKKCETNGLLGFQFRFVSRIFTYNMLMIRFVSFRESAAVAENLAFKKFVVVTLHSNGLKVA